MKSPHPPARRGQPLAALGLLMLIWIGARTALYAASPAALKPAVTAPAADQPGLAGQAAASGAAGPGAGASTPQRVPARPVPARSLAPPAQLPPPNLEMPKAVPPRIAAAHQALFLAGTAALPLPEDTMAAAPGVAASAPPIPFLPTAGEEARRWSADGWLLWREGGNGFNLPGAGLPGAGLPSGAYGASQAGLVLRYRLAPASALRPTLYLRGSSGLYYPRGEELAVGLAIRPIKALPVALMAEGRLTRTPGGEVVRPAVAAVTELPPIALPLGFRAESYAQAGWVGGKEHTPFFDGQTRVERPVVRAGGAELRVGAGAWGGAQRGASRLDIGPSATLSLPVGPVGTRLSADYRFRVAGDAAPGSGAAVTFSAGF